MKFYKSLLLLALALNPNVESFSQVRGADIENIFKEENYRHSKARKVGEIMPYPIGKVVTSLEMYILHSEGVEGAKRPFGTVYGFDRNGDNISEYEYLVRLCDVNKKVKIYAAYDVPNKLLYVDSSRDNYIDSIVELDSIMGANLPTIPTKCEEEKKKTYQNKSKANLALTV